MSADLSRKPDFIVRLALGLPESEISLAEGAMQALVRAGIQVDGYGAAEQARVEQVLEERGRADAAVEDSVVRDRSSKRSER